MVFTWSNPLCLYFEYSERNDPNHLVLTRNVNQKGDKRIMRQLINISSLDSVNKNESNRKEKSESWMQTYLSKSNRIWLAVKKTSNSLICKGKCCARWSIMAKEDSHKTSSSEDNYWGSKSVGHHCCMISKHLAHMVLHIRKVTKSISWWQIK